MHGHDWHAGLAPAYLAARGEIGRREAVFTVHNLGYQGEFPAEVFGELALPPAFFSIHGLEFFGKVNFMKAGLHYADRITTVSPTYAREIQTAEFGFGMEGLLRSRAGAVSGILNGVDRAVWNPATDARIAARYNERDIAGKRACRDALRAELGLGAAAGPLFGVVSRLTEQKGIDLVLDALPALVAADAQLVVLGSGDTALERRVQAAAVQHPGRVAVRIGYDEDLAHRIFAGSDVLLVPSRFEPCGLTQLYALAYGSLPLVHAVGGLADSVHDCDAAGAQATGFTFRGATAAALEAALERVFALWRTPARWERVRSTAMREDFGWAGAARAYLRLYRDLRPQA